MTIICYVVVQHGAYHMCTYFFSVGGTVDVAGLLKLISKCMPNPITTAEELREAFQVFDKQGNGMIAVLVSIYCD